MLVSLGTTSGNQLKRNFCYKIHTGSRSRRACQLGLKFNCISLAYDNNDPKSEVSSLICS